MKFIFYLTGGEVFPLFDQYSKLARAFPVSNRTAGKNCVVLAMPQSPFTCTCVFHLFHLCTMYTGHTYSITLFHLFSPWHFHFCGPANLSKTPSIHVLRQPLFPNFPRNFCGGTISQILKMYTNTYLSQIMPLYIYMTYMTKPAFEFFDFDF